MDETINLMRILPADTAIQLWKLKVAECLINKQKLNNTSVLIYSKYGAISNVKQLLVEASTVRRKC